MIDHPVSRRGCHPSFRRRGAFSCVLLRATGASICYFYIRMSEPKVKKIKPDIRAITRLVPPSGNLVQGQSELPIDPQLAKEAADIIAASRNHYGGSEGDANLRK